MASMSRLRAVSQRLRGLARWHRRLMAVIANSRDDNFVGFDKYALHGSYHWRELDTNDAYRRKIETIIPLLTPTARCLDLGCGDGAYLSAVAESCREVVGIDADFHAIRLAKRELRRRRIDNVQCLQLTLSQVPKDGRLRQAPFDVVYSMDVIEHLPVPEELLDVACEVVSPNGWVAVGTPLFVSAELVSAYHVREFTKPEISTLLSTRLQLEKQLILPMTRGDGKKYEEGFYVGIGKPK